MLDGVRADTTPPEATAHILVSLDRFSLTMHEPAPNRPFGVATRRYRQEVPYVRTPGAFELEGRMPYVASTTLYDTFGQPLGTFRYALPHNGDPTELVAQLRADLEWVRQQYPATTLDVCLDGAKDLWKVMLAGLTDLPGPPLRKVADWYHFWERTLPVLAKLGGRGDRGVEEAPVDRDRCHQFSDGRHVETDG